MIEIIMLQQYTNFIVAIMRFLKTKNLVKHVYYFSDGAAIQYINGIKVFVSCASMLLTIKSLLLGIFFCNQSWQKPKHLVARASLQATKEGQILTPMQLYCWANKHVTGIFVSKQDIAEHSLKIEPRLQNAKTVVGTRSHQQIYSIG